MIKKYIGTGFVALGLLFSVSLAAPAQAASLTSAQVQAVISLLQSFGVDAGTIANVQATLSGSSSSPSCSTFADLIYGNFDINPGGRVSQLQTFLGIPSNTFGFGTYGPRTRTLWNSKCVGTSTGTIPVTPVNPASIEVDVDGDVLLNVAYKNLPMSKIVLVSVASSQEFDVDDNIQGSGGASLEERNKLAGDYYLKVIAHSTGREVARSASFYLGGKVATQVATEQVKCVFNGGTTEQKCYGYAPSPTVGNPTYFSCSGVGTCVVTVSGQQNTPVTWGSSCGGSANTTIDNNNEYANFSCLTTTQPFVTVILPNGGEMVTLGKAIPITWKTSQPGVGSVSIYLKDEDNGKEFVLEDNTPNNGYYEAKTDAVSVPGIIADRAYRVSIWWDTTTNYAQNRNANDVSDSYFKIYSSTNQ